MTQGLTSDPGWGRVPTPTRGLSGDLMTAAIVDAGNILRRGGGDDGSSDISRGFTEVACALALTDQLGLGSAHLARG